MTTLSLPASSYHINTIPAYIDSAKVSDIYNKIAFKSNLLLSGPKGIAKSLSLRAFAKQTNTPLITVDCSEDLRRANLIGSYTLKGAETPFILGPIPTAFEVANTEGSAILAFEEINALSPQMQKLLNPLCDFRKRIEIPECQRVFELNPNSKLWVVGTLNSGYAGIYDLNEDLKSRFRILKLDYPDISEEKKLVKELLVQQNISISKDLFTQVFTLVKETRGGKLNYILATRDIVALFEDISMLGIQDALRLQEGKFEEALPVFKERVHSIFGI